MPMSSPNGAMQQHRDRDARRLGRAAAAAGTIFGSAKAPTVPSAATVTHAAPRGHVLAERAADAARREQREQQHRQREDRMADEQRQILEQRQLDGDEARRQATRSTRPTPRRARPPRRAACRTRRRPRAAGRPARPARASLAASHRACPTASRSRSRTGCRRTRDPRAAATRPRYCRERLPAGEAGPRMAAPPRRPGTISGVAIDHVVDDRVGLLGGEGPLAQHEDHLRRVRRAVSPSRAGRRSAWPPPRRPAARPSSSRAAGCPRPIAGSRASRRRSGGRSRPRKPSIV